MRPESRFTQTNKDLSTGSSTVYALKGLRRAAYTLWFPPGNEGLQSHVANLTKDEPLPLQPPIEVLIDEMKDNVLNKVDKSKVGSIIGTDLIKIAGVLINFTDHVPQLQDYADTPYRHIESIYEAITERSETDRKKLTYSDHRQEKQ